MNLKITDFKAGSLDRKITVQKYGTVKNGFGEAIPNESPETFKAWAHYNYKGGNEKEEADQIASFKKVFFVVRYNSNTTTIKENDKILLDNKVYEVRAIGELENTRHRFLLIRTELID